MSADNFAPWKAKLVAAIVDAIKAEKKNGTFALGVYALLYATKIPPGGPVGVNAAYMMHNHWFPEACAQLPAKYKSFVIGGAA